MDNQHKHIDGYRDLSQEEIDLMNSAKQIGQKIRKLIHELSTLDDTDKRWLAIAQTDLQKGIMSLVRSIARPTTF